MTNNATIKMVDTNNQLKSRSEARFSMMGSKTSPLYSSRQWVEVLNCLLDLEHENWQVYLMLEKNSKWKWM